MPAHLKQLSASLLLETAVSGSGRAAAHPASSEQLERWFCDHFDTLWRLAVRLGVPRGNVDDVVQEAFITAGQRAPDISPGSERRFLISTTIKLSANFRRRQHSQREHLKQFAAVAEHAPDAEQLLARKQLRQWLDVALEELPIEQRAVLILYETEDFSVPEIAELLEIPEGTVASRLGRARAKFSRAAARLQARWSRGE
jgi:RNA polymerase sigma-70 factor (ECF subfamily)